MSSAVVRAGVFPSTLLLSLACCATGCAEVRQSQDSSALPHLMTYTVSEPAFTFGLEPGQELYRLTGGGFAASSIVLSHSGDSSVLLINPATGDVVGTGGRGAGPGELQWPDLVPDCMSDSLLVADRQLSRVSWFGADGAYTRVVTLRHPQGARGWGQSPVVLGRSGDGQLLVYEHDAWSPTHGGRQRLHATVRFYDDDGQPAGKLFSVPGREIHFATAAATGTFTALRFYQRTTIALDCNRNAVHYVTGPDAVLKSVSLDSWRALAVTPTAQEMPLPIAATSLEKSVYDAWVDWQISRIPAATRDQTKEYYDLLFEPVQLPPVEDVFVDGAGRIWVKQYSVDPGHTWLIMSPDAVTAVLELPRDAHLLDAAGDRLLLKRGDDLGREFVEVRQLTPS